MLVESCNSPSKPCTNVNEKRMKHSLMSDSRSSFFFNHASIDGKSRMKLSRRKNRNLKLWTDSEKGTGSAMSRGMSGLKITDRKSKNKKSNIILKKTRSLESSRITTASFDTKKHSNTTKSILKLNNKKGDSFDIDSLFSGITSRSSRSITDDMKLLSFVRPSNSLSCVSDMTGNEDKNDKERIFIEIDCEERQEMRFPPQKNFVIDCAYFDGIDCICLEARDCSNPKMTLYRTFQRSASIIHLEKEKNSLVTKKSKCNDSILGVVMEGGRDEEGCSNRWAVNIPKDIFFSEKEKQLKKEKSEQKIDKIPENMRDLLAEILMKGDFGNATKLVYQVLSFLRESRNKEHPSVTCNLHNLGNIQLLMERYDEAKLSYLAAAQVRRKTSNGVNYDEIVSIAKLGFCLYLKGRLEQAQKIFAKALSDINQHFPNIFPVAGKMSNNLGCVFFRKGDYVTALKVFRASLGLLSRISPDTIEFSTVLCNMSQVFRKRGEVVESVVLLEQALSIQKKLLHKDHEIIKNTKDNLLYNRDLGKNFIKAEKDCESLMRLLQETQNSQTGKYFC